MDCVKRRETTKRAENQTEGCYGVDEYVKLGGKFLGMEISRPALLNLPGFDPVLFGRLHAKRAAYTGSNGKLK